MTHGYFPYASHDRIQLFGTLNKGGRLILEGAGRTDRPIPLELPPRLYQIVWLLMEAAHKDASEKTRNPLPPIDSSPIGFRDPKQLAARHREVCHHCDDQLSAEQIPALILRLRSLLTSKVSRRWAYDFLEYQKFLGYRLSTQPKNQGFG